VCVVVVGVVTGGAGFIGGHLVRRLLGEGWRVVVVDDFSVGRLENVAGVGRVVVVGEDLRAPVRLWEVLEGCDVVFHLAANPEVRVGEVDPGVHYGRNVGATFSLLEVLRRVKQAKTVVFASSSTVYGDASVVPTGECYAPLLPISSYGASKLACEALLSAYCFTYGHRGLILRLANVVGPGSNHGVVSDFVKKIRANSDMLEVLGDGTQEKSYLHVDDCIEAMMYLTKRFLRGAERVDVFNVGSSDKITVKKIARIVAEEMRVPKIRLRFTGGVDGGRGWKGDVKVMQLSTDKLVGTGWKAKYTSEQAVRLTARALCNVGSVD